jgi:polyhydroxyalkanoate synthesis repressor PhaR
MPVLIKRYANRKLYNTETSRYITLKGIAELLENGKDVQVTDNESGEDITSVTLSQILVDTERGGREVPGNLLSELFQKGGDAIYDALRKGVGDASEGIEELQRGVRKILRPEGNDWIAFGPPDFDQMVQRAFERVANVLDLPRKADLDTLNANLERVAKALEKHGVPVDPAPRDDE